LPDILALRRFNRLYTQRLGLLKPHLDGSAFSLTEARVMYELAHRQSPTSAEIADALSLDRGQLSRILAAFAGKGLLASAPSPDHAKHRLLALTAAGKRAYKTLEQGTNDHLASLLSTFNAAERARLLTHATRMSDVLETASSKSPKSNTAGFSLRPLRPGDLGAVTQRQAILYFEEHGFDWTYEGLVAEILAGYVKDFNPARDDAWIAEQQGEMIGSVFLVRGARAKQAKLRLLYVEPGARGLGVGQGLVTACVDRARALGYRTIELWTNDILVSARRLYEREGFVLVSEAPHRSFGKDLVGQVFRKKL
jgi:DNA-binding MarR family transcriptional regulator/GNAT superfamily N-acetyltransferase